VGPPRPSGDPRGLLSGNGASFHNPTRTDAVNRGRSLCHGDSLAAQRFICFLVLRSQACQDAWSPTPPDRGGSCSPTNLVPVPQRGAATAGSLCALVPVCSRQLHLLSGRTRAFARVDASDLPPLIGEAPPGAKLRFEVVFPFGAEACVAKGTIRPAMSGNAAGARARNTHPWGVRLVDGHSHFHP
jgi:hypothetical protein